MNHRSFHRIVEKTLATFNSQSLFQGREMDVLRLISRCL